MFDRHRRWSRKFADALRGMREGIRGQHSFAIHIPAALLAMVMGIWLLDLTRFSLLLLCVTSIVTTEMMNSAIEWLARAVTDHHDERVRNALDIGGGAVLLISLGATTAAGLLLVDGLARRLGIW